MTLIVCTSHEVDACAHRACMRASAEPSRVTAGTKTTCPRHRLRSLANQRGNKGTAEVPPTSLPPLLLRQELPQATREVGLLGVHQMVLPANNDLLQGTKWQAAERARAWLRGTGLQCALMICAAAMH